MRKIQHLTIALLSIFTFISFSYAEDSVSDNVTRNLYDDAYHCIQKKNWKKAIKKLKKIEYQYPFSVYTKQIQLDLIYVYYHNDDFSLALTYIDRLIYTDPTNANIDYVIYMKGIIHMSMDENRLHRFFGINRSDRDPHYIYDALNDFSQLIKNYPESQYVPYAESYTMILRERLSRYEYSIACYYVLKGAWIAVINRIDLIIKNYPDTKIIKDSLKLMENAYRNIHVPELADIVKNYSNIKK